MRTNRSPMPFAFGSSFSSVFKECTDFCGEMALRSMTDPGQETNDGSQTHRFEEVVKHSLLLLLEGHALGLLGHC